MLDRKTGELLNLLNNLCVGGAYKILEISDLVLKMPQSFALDEEEIRESLRVLQEKDFIKIKYEDEREVCISTLPKGRFFHENMIDKIIEEKTEKRQYFIYGFLGAFFGSAFFTIIAFLLRLIFR